MRNHTQGPWRWELNRKSKQITLAGGKPQYDLIVLDAVRWGMSSATVRFRADTDDGLNIMHAASDFAAPIAGREHHRCWLADVDHPDARLIAAAPELLEACKEVTETLGDFVGGGKVAEILDRARAVIARAEGTEAK